MNQALQDAINKAAPTVGMLPTDTITDDFLANLINALFRDILFFQNKATPSSTPPYSSNNWQS